MRVIIHAPYYNFNYQGDGFYMSNVYSLDHVLRVSTKWLRFIQAERMTRH